MILATDVQYVGSIGIVAGVLFNDWEDATPFNEYVSVVDGIENYTPGQFYKRELPCILKLLEEHSLFPNIIIVDGYVFLDGHINPGLGKHLYDALDKKINIVGVAKKAYFSIGCEHKVYRGKSKNPIFVTSIGQKLNLSRENILSMYGEYRISALLKRADQLCREKANKKMQPTQKTRG